MTRKMKSKLTEITAFEILKSFLFSFVHAFVTIYFKEDTFIESKRSELYGWTNFLASCGGLKNILEFSGYNIFLFE